MLGSCDKIPLSPTKSISHPKGYTKIQNSYLCNLSAATYDLNSDESMALVVIISIDPLIVSMMRGAWMKKTCVYFCLLGFAAMVLLAGCNEPRLKSKWLDREITIDGIDSEWEDCRLYYDEDTRTSLGIYNDEEYLYLSFSTADRLLQRKILGQGLYTWFNPKGNTAKEVGILFPTGMMGKFTPGRGDREDGEDFGENGRPGGQSILLRRNLEMSSPDIEIHIPGKGYENNILLAEIASLGLDAELKHHGDRLAYELKIPLLDNDSMPDIVVAAGSGQIGIGFVTKEFDRKRGKFGGGHGGRDGGMGGPGGKGGGRGGGMGGIGGGMGGPNRKGGGFGGSDRSGMKGQLKVYELWIQVELASAK